MKDSEVEELINILKYHSEWFEDEAYNCTFVQINRQISNLTNAFGVIEQRKQIHNKRQIEGVKFQQKLNETRTKGRQLVKTKPWVEEYFQRNFSHKIRSLNKWYNDMTEKQNKIAYYEVDI